MTDHYVRSGAAGANNGTSEADAWTSLASAVSVAAGDRVFIATDHNEDPGNGTTWNFLNGTAANPVKLISYDFSTNSYSLAVSAQFSSVSGGDFVINGFVRGYGLYVDTTDDVMFGATERVVQIWEDCTFLHGDIFQAAVGAQVRNTFKNCTITKSGAASDPITVGNNDSKARFINCTFSGQGSVNFCQLGQRGASLEFHNCDVSAYSTLVNLVSGFGYSALFSRCKVATGVTLTNGTIGTSNEIRMEWCDDGTITVPALGLTEFQNLYGTVKATLARYRTGGANDGFQSNEFSWEMAASASALEIVSPLEVVLGGRVVAADGSISGATARGIFTSTRCAILGTPAALTTDGVSTWNGTNVGTKQKISHTLTNGQTLTVYVASAATLNNDDFWLEVSEPDQVGGLATVRVCLAKPSTTVYVCPKIEVV